MSNKLRFIVPNLITLFNCVLGILAIHASITGDYVHGAWLIMYAVLLDRVDGLMARLLRGTSELGVQLDSFADLISFGVAPSVLFFQTLRQLPAFDDGGGFIVLSAACTLWVLASVFRLARYNVASDDTPTKVFFGAPTTLIAGTTVIWFLALLKYSPGNPWASTDFGGAHLLGEFSVGPSLWRYAPVVLFIGAFLMASTLRIPKGGLVTSKVLNVLLVSNVVAGYLFCFARLYPEYLVWPPTIWIVTFLIWGAISREARSLVPPALFPDKPPAPGQAPIRPEDDLLPENTDPTLDGR